jgi:hypothetical protein
MVRVIVIKILYKTLLDKIMTAYSQHFLYQIQSRGITLKDIEDVLNNPDSIITEENLTMYQKLITENSKPYLLRIFVNEVKDPPLAVTAYKTSKINKYK